MLTRPPIRLPSLVATVALALSGAPALAAGLEPIQDYVNARDYGERDHSYPLLRCGALYLASLKLTGDTLEPERAGQIAETATKMVAVATHFRVHPGVDPEAEANRTMDQVEVLVADYMGRATGGRGKAFGADSLVKKDFKYCRTVTEPFVRNYDFNPPPQ
jgi:hypothetical protein